jgi:hypothetical protein
MLYFAHRKGWSIHDETITDEKKIKSFTERGARYLIIDKKTFTGSPKYPLIYNDNNFMVFKLPSE